MISNILISDTLKIHIPITISFISSEDHNDEESVMHSKSENIEIMIGDESDKVIKKLSVLFNYCISYLVIVYLCSVIVL